MPNQTGEMQYGTRSSLTVQWLKTDGTPARVDGKTTWASSDDAMVKVTPSSGNPLIATVEALGLGLASITASADADLGVGLEPVSSTIDITVIAAGASSGAMTLQPIA